MKIGDKVKIKADIPSIDGMLHKGTIVKIDEIKDDGVFRVVDTLGKIWWVPNEGLEDING
tara:strand:+ start:43 stop:222 length:180 start_codon:yes stop_codon:yes gene_type:complete